MELIHLFCSKLFSIFTMPFYHEDLTDNFLTSQESSTSIEMNKHINHQFTLCDFNPIKTLGRGTFGKVLLVYNSVLNKYFAMKVLKKNFLKKQNQINNTKTEREILQMITHPFIIKLHFAFQSEQSLYMITDFIAGGDLFYHLHKDIYFTEERTKLYTCELILAISHLHKNKIIYRDLKPENILLDSKGHIKLTDFGLSKILRMKRSSLGECCLDEINKTTYTYTICGTSEYLAPEVLLGKGYDKSVDWWSLGVVIYEMMVGFSPFKENKIKLDIKNYLKKVFHHKNISNIAFDLITRLLQLNPQKRLGFGNEDGEEIKKHPFFKDVNWDDVYNKRIQPTFIPKIKNNRDVSNFDPMFTEEDPLSDNEEMTKSYKLIKERENNFKFNEFENFSYRRLNVL